MTLNTRDWTQRHDWKQRAKKHGWENPELHCPTACIFQSCISDLLNFGWILCQFAAAHLFIGASVRDATDRSNAVEGLDDAATTTTNSRPGTTRDDHDQTHLSLATDRAAGRSSAKSCHLNGAKIHATRLNCRSATCDAVRQA